MGNNQCGGFGPPYCCGDDSGYGAQPGWDPVTGLGAPNFLVLYQAIEASFK